MKKRITIKDIAEKAGVSAGTVDRIIHNRGNVSEKAKEAVDKVLDEIGYKPNIHLSGISLKKTYEIVIITPHVSPGEYWGSIHQGISEAVHQYESINIKTTVLTYDQYNIYSCREVFNKLLLLSPDAVIIGPTFKDETMALAKELDKNNIPFVFVDSMVEDTSPLASFSSDQYICGYLMCKLLKTLIPETSDMGILQALRIGDQSANTTILRRKGVMDFLEETHFKNKVHNIQFSITEPHKNEELLSNFFLDKPNVKGVIVLNSRGNVVADFIKRKGIKDVKLVCMDLTHPNIRSLKEGYIEYLISQNPDYQGYMAMKTLLEFLILRIKGKVKNYLPMNIVTREIIDLHLEFNILNRV